MTLNAGEVARACERFVRDMNVSDSAARKRYVAHVAWRGEYAEVSVEELTPTLVDAVAGPGAA